jgi:predicted phage terminase large subunit-like protein
VTLRIAIGCDPAIGASSRADYFVVAAVGMELPVVKGNLRLHTLDIVRGRWEAPDQPQVIIDAWEKWRPYRIVIESIFYQHSVFQYLMRTRPDIRWEKIKPEGDKAVRLDVLAYHYKAGHVFHPPHGPTEPRWLRDYEEELCAIGWLNGKPLHKHEDQADAVVLAINLLTLSARPQEARPVAGIPFTVDAGNW